MVGFTSTQKPGSAVGEFTSLQRLGSVVGEFTSIQRRGSAERGRSSSTKQKQGSAVGEFTSTQKQGSELKEFTSMQKQGSEVGEFTSTQKQGSAEKNEFTSDESDIFDIVLDSGTCLYSCPSNDSLRGPAPLRSLGSQKSSGEISCIFGLNLTASIVFFNSFHLCLAFSGSAFCSVFLRLASGVNIRSSGRLLQKPAKDSRLFVD